MSEITQLLAAYGGPINLIFWISLGCNALFVADRIFRRPEQQNVRRFDRVRNATYNPKAFRRIREDWRQ